MRRLVPRRTAVGTVALAGLVACAEWGRPPLMSGYEAGAPLVQEQALVGLDSAGNAAALQLVDAEGRPAQLDLLVLDGGGGPTRRMARAPSAAAAAAAAELRARGDEIRPLLAGASERAWPEAVRGLRERGFAPSSPRSGGPEWRIDGAPAAGSVPLSLRVALDERGDPPGFALLLSEPSGTGVRATQIDLVRQPIAGTPIEGGVWVSDRVVWLLSGSVDRKPLRRLVGLRRGSLSRGEARLHDLHGVAAASAGDLEGARRALERAIAADPEFFDALYDAAAVAARLGDAEEAVALLRRAARVDGRRVEVQGRDDPDLKPLRGREDVRALLGMRRPPPE